MRRVTDPSQFASDLAKQGAVVEHPMAAVVSPALLQVRSYFRRLHLRPIMRRPKLSDIRNFIDRRLHHRRRASALQEIAVRPVPRSFLFLCYGNICRSPYAARAFERLIRSSSLECDRIDSAGFVGPGRPTPPDGIVVAGMRHVELKDHVSKVFTPDLIRGHDLVVVMDSSQRRGLRRRFGSEGHILILGDLDPWPIETRTVFDPWKHSASGFERSYDRIDRCLDELRRALELSRASRRAAAQLNAS